MVGGPFRWVRNPGYVSVVTLLVGQALVFGSPGLLGYAAVVAIAFHLFVILYEEPTLRRKYGGVRDVLSRGPAVGAAAGPVPRER